MTREQRFFLGVLADFLHGKNTEPPEGLDWAKITAYARSHQVEGIIWNQCKDYIKSRIDLKEIWSRLESSSAATLFYYENNSRVCKKLGEELKKQRIPFFFVKGLDVAALYPVPGYRTMGDLDLVIKPADADEINEILYRLGFQRKVGERVKLYANSTTKLEVHEQLINEVNLETKTRRKFFNGCWKYVKTDNDGSCALDWNFHFLFLVEHTKQHFSASGVGFRQFMDLAVAAQQKKDLDWNWIEKKLKEISLWDFTVMAFAFIERWWGISSPLPVRELDNSFFGKSTEFVFENGVFGFDNENAGAHLIEKQMRISSVPKILRSLRVALKKVFISYNSALVLPYCSFIKGKKFLLPFAWIYRVFYVAKHKKGNISRAVKLVFCSREAIDNHRQLMDGWGV